jgi:hypothetical protein
MNVPSVFRKAVDGFIIPPRTFFQMLFSAGQGAVGLMDEVNRQEFIEKLDKGTINEGVISQATAGPMVMLSLFNDLQNPLFKRHQFDAAAFLEGVGPALERFHNVSGSLENQLRKIQEEAKTNDLAAEKEKVPTKVESSSATEEASEGKTSAESESREDEPVTISSSSFPNEFIMLDTDDKNIAAMLEHDWMDDAKKDPDSLAAQLSQMVTDELFNIHQFSAKTSFLLQPNRNVTFKEGSCAVNNVALLSARSFLCVEKDTAEDLEEWGENKTDSKYEMIDYDIDETELKKRKGGVAAQVEILYDVTQEFVNNDPEEGSNAGDEKSEDMDTTIVSVAVMEGWLSGGPDDELRWRLALHRPAFEFPGMQQ